MATSAPALPDTVRRLAGMRAPEPQVLSLYINLDPSDVPTAPDQATAIRAILDEAGRQIEAGRDRLSHEALRGLREDLEAANGLLQRVPLELGGGKALAVFRCGAIGLDEEVPLPRPVPARAILDSAPHCAPLLGVLDARRWCVALVNRQVGRFMLGTRDRLDEIAGRRDPVHGQHDQGGWSQAGYERSIEHDVLGHLKNTAEALREVAFDHLVVAAPRELQGAFLDRLPADVRERLVDCVEADVEHSTPEQVLAAVAPVIEAEDRGEERRRLDRLIAGVGSGGRGAAGLEATLAALVERRVETLAYEEGFTSPGKLCPRDGWMGVDGAESCPIDGSPLQARENIVEDAVLAAVAQAADVLVVRHYPDLGPHGRIGAILRF